MWSRAGVLAGLLALAAAPAPAAAASAPAAAHPRAPAAHHRHRATHHRRPARARARVRPRAFASCAALVGYSQRHFAVTGGRPDPPIAGLPEPALAPVAISGGSARPAPVAPQSAAAAGGASGTPAFSTTNVQEAGVDEPDVAKTNGSTIFFVSGSHVYAISVAGGTPQLVGSLDLGPTLPYGVGSQLLLRGDRLIVISRAAPLPVLTAGGGGVTPRQAPAPSVPPAIAISPYYDRGQTVVSEVDVSNPGALRITRTMAVDGTFVDARQNGSTARLVIASAPLAISDAPVRARAAGWVPARRFHSFLTGRRYTRPVAGCATIDRPVQFSGLGMLTILTLNLDKGLWTAGSQALMADAQVVYGSTGNLYVATQKWIDPAIAVDQLPAQTTVIDQLDATNPDATTFVASGEVPGYLLNQFSLSEYNGYLRAATTSRPIWWGGGPPEALSQSFVTVLQDQGGQLATVGQVSGLGAGQQIYSVRFVGSTGYVVTFRQVDPLYVIDLSTPAAPAVTGQLELEGYSSYLHPLGNGLLLGIGSGVGAGNEPSGTQLELFDVSNPKAPALVQRTTLGAGSSSQALFDHHAFLFWPPTALAVLPVELLPQSYPPPQQPGASSGSGSQQPFVGAIGFHADRSGIAEVGRVTHPSSGDYTWPIQRAIVIGDRLFTLSDAGVMASRLDTLAPLAFAAFPAPTPYPFVSVAPASARH